MLPPTQAGHILMFLATTVRLEFEYLNVSRNHIIPLELYRAPWPSLEDVARFLEAKKYRMLRLVK